MSFFNRILGKDPPPEPPPPPPTPTATPPDSGGFMQRFRQGLQKTYRVLNTDVRDLFKREGEDGRLIDEPFLTELFAILVKTDMGAGPAAEIRDRVKVDLRGRVVRMEDVLN